MIEFIKYVDLNKKENRGQKFFTGIPITMEEHEITDPERRKITVIDEDGNEVEKEIDKEIVAVQNRLDVTIHLYRYKKSYRLSILKEYDTVPDEYSLPVISFKKLNKKLKKLSKSLGVDTIVFI